MAASRSLAAILCTIVLFHGGAAAAQTFDDEVVFVPPDALPFTFTLTGWENGGPPEAVMHSYTSTTHGSIGDLSGEPGTFTFNPTDSFWTVGVDSFTYVATVPAGPGKLEVQRAFRVYLVQGQHGQSAPSEPFDTATLNSALWPVQNQPTGFDITSAAAIHGDYGLEIRGFMSTYPSNSYIGTTPLALGSDERTVACGHLSIDLLPLAPPPTEASNTNMRIYQSLHSSNGNPHTRWVLRWANGAYRLKVVSSDLSGAIVATPYAELAGNGPWNFELDWWIATAEHSAGLMAFVDGEYMGRLDDLQDPDPGVSSFRFGALTSTQDFDIPFGMDNIELAFGPPGPALQELLADGFEQGLIDWATTANSGPEQVTDDISAALTGNLGLMVPVSSPTSAYLRDISPAADGSMSVSFLVDEGDAALSDGAAILLHAIGASEVGPSGNSFATPVAGDNLVETWAVAGGEQGNIEIHVRLQLDDGSYLSIGQFDLTTSPQKIDLEWAAAGDTGANDGRFRLWVDGVLVGEALQLDNDAKVAEATYLGRLISEQGITESVGAFHIDDYESWR